MKLRGKVKLFPEKELKARYMGKLHGFDGRLMVSQYSDLELENMVVKDCIAGRDTEDEAFLWWQIEALLRIARLRKSRVDDEWKAIAARVSDAMGRPWPVLLP